MRGTLVTLLAATAATFLLAGTAMAGEITGSGKETPIKSRQTLDNPAGPANSFCAFSGLNDDPAEDGNRTQSWGTGVADAPVEERVFFATEGLIQEFGPGTACRGGNFELE